MCLRRARASCKPYRGSAHFLRLIVQLSYCILILSCALLLTFVYLLFFSLGFPFNSKCECVAFFANLVDLVLWFSKSHAGDLDDGWRKWSWSRRTPVEILDSFFRWTCRGTDRYFFANVVQGTPERFSPLSDSRTYRHRQTRQNRVVGHGERRLFHGSRVTGPNLAVHSSGKQSADFGFASSVG